MKNINLRMPKGFDRTIHLTMFILFLFGTLMIGSTLTPKGIDVIKSALIKQVLYFVVGYIGLSILSRTYNFKTQAKLVDKLFIVVFVIMFIPRVLYTLLPGAYSHYGIADTYAWISVFGFTIQPSEFFKVLIILKMSFLLKAVDQCKKKSQLFELAVIKPLKFSVMVFVAFFFQKDNGSLIIAVSMIGVMYLSSSSPNLRRYQRQAFILMIGLLLLALVVAPFILNGSRLSRLTILTNPTSESQNEGFQLVNGLVAMTRGGLFGAGFGQSIYKNGWIPVAESDFIIAIIIEELGIFGFAIIFIGYTIIVYRLLNYAKKIYDERGRTILIGTASLFIIHFFVNIGGVTMLIPMTGVPLLFISAGGSALWGAMFALGLSQNIISRYKKGEIK